MTVAASASATDVGQRRSHNEDAILEHAPLFAVADGVGGAARGEVASAGALEVLASYLASIAATPTADGAAAQLAAAVDAANSRVHEHAQAVPASAGMATTLTAALVREDGQLVIAHVGDSRAYRIDPTGPAVQLTEDHSVVGELLRSGRIDAEEAMHHPQRNVITRAVGPEQYVQVDTLVLPIHAGEVLLLCSDGLTGHLDATEIADIVRGAGSLGGAAAALVDTANERGGLDNISVVLAEFGPPSRQPPPPLGDVNPASISGELRIDPMLLDGPRTAPAGDTAHVQERAGAHVADSAGDGDASTDIDDELTITPQSRPPRRTRRRDRANRGELDPAVVARRRRLAVLRTLSIIAALVLIAFALGSIAWQRSYFLVQRGDGTLGIDQGFPVSHLHRRFSSSDTIVSTLTDADRNRLLGTHTLHSRHDAERLLDQAGNSNSANDTPTAPRTATTGTTATTATATAATTTSTAPAP